jgi:hypothetical protein
MESNAQCFSRKRSNAFAILVEIGQRDIFTVDVSGCGSTACRSPIEQADRKASKINVVVPMDAQT